MFPGCFILILKLYLKMTNYTVAPWVLYFHHSFVQLLFLPWSSLAEGRTLFLSPAVLSRTWNGHQWFSKTATCIYCSIMNIDQCEYCLTCIKCNTFLHCYSFMVQVNKDMLKARGQIGHRLELFGSGRWEHSLDDLSQHLMMEYISIVHSSKCSACH